MHPDFKRLASMRKFMMRGDPRQAPNFGRDHAAQWISRQGIALPKGIKIKPTGFGRIITPRAPATHKMMIYIHGGGLVYYDTAVFTPFLAQLSQQIGIKIAAVDYPKAPETPAQDILASIKKNVLAILRDNPNCEITLAGDSVGGLLAMRIAQSLRKGQFKDLHLIYPVTDPEIDPECRFGTGHFLDSQMMDWFYTFIDPLFDVETPIAQLPQTTVHIAETDILAHQGQAFANELKLNGRLKACHTYSGLPHDFCLFAGAIQAARSAIQQIGQSMMDTVDA